MARASGVLTAILSTCRFHGNALRTLCLCKAAPRRWGCVFYDRVLSSVLASSANEPNCQTCFICGGPTVSLFNGAPVAPAPAAATAAAATATTT